ncbi:MAG: hypothetical protein VB078_11460 [Clostridiaceae bacterium]|nr:hypothetical protein [Clostridiaceae bacterium]
MMLGLFTSSIVPYNNLIESRALYAPLDKGIESSVLRIGKAEVLHINLVVPLSVSRKAFEKKARRALELMRSGGVDEAAVPHYLAQGAQDYRIRRAVDLPGLRKRAAEAVLDSLGQTAGGSYVKIYARMPSKDVSDCVFSLAEQCRYVTVAGGQWAGGVRKKLLREYGTAAPSALVGTHKVAVVFDGGFGYGGEDLVLDLTPGELRCQKRVRPKLEVIKECGLPKCGFYDKSAMIGAVLARGGFEQREVCAYCNLDR